MDARRAVGVVRSCRTIARMPSSRLLRAGLLTGVVDGLFASVQSLVTGSTLARLWQGVASVLLGKSALHGDVSRDVDRCALTPRRR